MRSRFRDTASSPDLSLSENIWSRITERLDRSCSSVTTIGDTDLQLHGITCPYRSSKPSLTQCLTLD
ncbi:hypothetical protein TNCV_2691271 [Trichonephila clavipes]|uniref:Uncharacterized protein n=1 Tax=Trichonephila clavipes TaxID=2585209 RepID=A0A8X6VYY2_TRICX|nr:hypothetical protein TNCV_2691271 [Trichonephila clavipes]